MTIRQLGESMDSAEFAEWVAFDRIEPLPMPWLQTGVIAAAAANAPGLRKRPALPPDFVPKPRRRPPRQSAGQIKSLMGAVLAPFRAAAQGS